MQTKISDTISKKSKYSWIQLKHYKEYHQAYEYIRVLRHRLMYKDSTIFESNRLFCADHFPFVIRLIKCHCLFSPICDVIRCHSFSWRTHSFQDFLIKERQFCFWYSLSLVVFHPKLVWNERRAGEWHRKLHYNDKRQYPP